MSSGAAQVPTVDILSQNIEGSNNIDFSDFRIYQPFGPGIWVHQAGTGSISQDSRQLRFTNTKIEGSNIERVLGAGGDLVEFGDAAPQTAWIALRQGAQTAGFKDTLPPTRAK